MARPLKSGNEYRKHRNVSFTDSEWNQIRRFQRDHGFASVADLMMDFLAHAEREEAERRAMVEQQKRDERAKEEAEMRAIIRAHCKRMSKK